MLAAVGRLGLFLIAVALRGLGKEACACRVGESAAGVLSLGKWEFLGRKPQPGGQCERGVVATLHLLGTGVGPLGRACIGPLSRPSPSRRMLEEWSQAEGSGLEVVLRGGVQTRVGRCGQLSVFVCDWQE